MEIKYHHGDAVEIARVLDAPLVHGCNAMGVMGSGFAAMIARDFPEAEAVYLRAFDEGELTLGSFTIADTSGLKIVNLVTQFNTSRTTRMTNYEAVARGFEALNKAGAECGMKHLVMPAIGADLGGGSWRVISAIIETEMTLVQPHVCYLNQTDWDRIKST